MPATLVGQLGSKTGSKTKPVSVNRRALILWAINRFQMPASHFAVLMAITAKIEAYQCLNGEPPAPFRQ